MTSPSNDDPSVLLSLCPQCDLVLERPVLRAGESAHCPRCRHEVAGGAGAGIDRALALLATAAILLLVMNVFPLVSMRTQGVTRTTTLIGAVLELQRLGMTPIALLVAATTVVGPVLEVVLLALLLAPLRFSRLARAAPPVIGWLQRIRPWSMVEVLMLGIIVSVVKLSAQAEIVTGPALWACAGLILISALLKATLRPDDLWDWSRHAPQ